jgi:dolichol-phosphate mannosyltransferase
MSTAATESLAVVIPSFNEGANGEELVRRIVDSLPTDLVTTLYFIDDSNDGPDGTVAMLTAVRQKYVGQLDVVVVHREENINQLAGAVTHGMTLARHDLVLVMDGDLQHRPEDIPALLVAARQADLVVASRYCRGGTADGLNGPIRHLVSKTSTWLAKLLFPWALRGVTDPMTGFFLVRRSSLDLDKLQAAGFKILLELLVTHPTLSRREVPIVFAARQAGTSKGDIKQGLRYVQQLFRLRVPQVFRISINPALNPKEV